ncbi:MAG: MBL fold metallo-hydrolase RNA specificity domain-containing protein, partial [Candidatus Roizmanbacteria bacterium]
KVARMDREAHPLYSEDDVLAVLKLPKLVKYHEKFMVKDLTIEYVDAGHILGSASIIISDNGKTIVFGGDIGNFPEDLVAPTEFIPSADVVIMESTYGDREHPKDEHPDEVLAREVTAIEESGGALLIPAFSLERTQVLLHKLDHLKKANKIKLETPVFLDSPMAIKATDIYKSFEKLMNSEIQGHVLQDDPFDFPGLHLISKHEESEHIFFSQGPKVILAGSGMMSGGRIIGHAKNFLPLATTRLLIIGFQGEGTLGRKISEGATEVEIDGISIPVKATLTELHSLSAHADKSKLLTWLKEIKGVSHVFLTHGEEEARTSLGATIKEEGICDAITYPKLDQTISLFTSS